MKKRLIYILIPLFLLIITLFNLNTTKSDAIKFKIEYEKDNNKYYKMKINDTNPIKYSNYDEVFKILDNGTGVIYIGYSKCNNCRKLISKLIKSANDNELKDIYYLNIKDDMDYYVVSDKKLKYKVDTNGKELKGTDNYFKLLDILDEHLDKYIIKDGKKEYDTSEKRIKNPTIIFIKDGKITKLIDEYNENENYYDIFEENIIELFSESCSTDGKSKEC